MFQLYAIIFGWCGGTYYGHNRTICWRL